MVTALARVSSAMRSLTGITKATEPSAPTRPTRWARRAANPASSVLLVPPSDCARASHSSPSRKAVAVGSVMSSSAPAIGAAGLERALEGADAADPALVRLRLADRAAATADFKARRIPGMSRTVWRASSRSARHRGRDPAAGQFCGVWPHNQLARCRVTPAVAGAARGRPPNRARHPRYSPRRRRRSTIRPA